MTGTEYRVTWQREGLPKKYRFYQSRPAADRLMRVLRGEGIEELENPDDYACCSGYECACGGMTNREAWEQRFGTMPPLVFGPVLTARPVGDWGDA